MRTGLWPVRFLLLTITGTYARSEVPPLPAISIIIDDMGKRLQTGQRVIDLPGPVACAFLPQAKHTSALADLAWLSDKEVMLHLPMQASNGRALGPGGLHLDLDRDAFARVLRESGLAWVVLFFFGAGVLLAFTACMYPMIPIISSIIVGHGENITTGKAFMLTLIYVEAVAITYAIIGVISAQLGAGVQAFFQNPWILGMFALIFVLLALSMFGFYELQLPGRLQTRLTEASNRQQGGQLWGVAVMGFLSALIVGPCVAPPLMAALIVIGSSGDAVLGGSALFALAMGMGTPLIAFGVSAGKLVPRAGAWMDAVKAVFGVAMLGLSIWMLERILPGGVIMLLWGALAIGCAIYLGALERIEPGASGWRRLWKALGVMLLVFTPALYCDTSDSWMLPSRWQRAMVGMAGIAKISLAGTPFITSSILLWLIALAVSWFMIRPALNEPSEEARKLMAAGIGVIFGLLTAICYAGYLLILRKGRDRRRAAGPIFDSTLTCGLTALAAGLIVGERLRLVEVSL